MSSHWVEKFQRLLQWVMQGSDQNLSPEYKMRLLGTP